MESNNLMRFTLLVTTFILMLMAIRGYQVDKRLKAIEESLLRTQAEIVQMKTKE